MPWDRSDEGVSYATLNIFVTLSRRPGFYLWSVALPLALLVLLAFISVFMPISDLDNRLQITLTLLLTFVAFKIVVSQYVPAPSYQTWLDMYVTQGFVFLFLLAVLQNYAPYMLDRQHQDQVSLVRNFNFGMALGLLLLWVAVHMSWAWHCSNVWTRREEFSVLDDEGADPSEWELPDEEPSYVRWPSEQVVLLDN